MMSDKKDLPDAPKPDASDRRTLSRRQFTAYTAALAAAVAAGRIPTARSSVGKSVAANPNATVDYIVVGSGPGGGPLACNLAMAGFKVLLLEAGDEHADVDPILQPPLFHPAAGTDPRITWSYFVRHYTDETQQMRDDKFVADEDGILYPRCATLGGCAAHNALITVYPSNGDFDFIAEVTGDESWSAPNMRKIFERIENCHYVTPVPAGEPNVTGHGFSGYLSTELSEPGLFTQDPQLTQLLQAAFEQFGTPEEYQAFLNKQLDPNSLFVIDNEIEGFFPYPLSRKNGIRTSPRDLIRATRAALPNNLIVQTNTLVCRVLFSGKTAIGVEVMEGQSLYRADANAAQSGPELPRTQIFAGREVIVSAGAFNSPQILKLSGIGPAAELQALGIPMVVDLPGVGANLQDRYELSVNTQVKQDFNTLIPLCNPALGATDPCRIMLEQGVGPYTTDFLAVANLRRSDPLLPERDLAIFLAGGPFTGYYPGWEVPCFTVFNQYSWLILKAHTNNNAGTVMLRSTDPRDTPLINFHYFFEGTDTQGKDLEAVVDAVEFIRQINAQVPDIIDAELKPGPAVQSRADITQYALDECYGHHATCTCKIGPVTDRMAVVDSKFRVHGTTNVRVVDASVFPKIPGFFPALPTLMLSEKATDDIIATATGRDQTGGPGSL
jgi:choline dehydrogenase